MNWDKLRNDTTFYPNAAPSKLMVEVFEKLKPIPGWFNVDDAAHFSLLLATQSALGLRGDLGEIGVYHGRAACLMVRYLAPDEKLLLCDVFDTSAVHYENPPTAQQALENICRVNPELSLDRLEVIVGESQSLSLEDHRPFRFFHVDGGHSKAIALADMHKVSPHIAPGGVICVDDYSSRLFPGVTKAVDAFLDENTQFRVLADLNRHGAIGRKIYLVRSL